MPVALVAQFFHAKLEPSLPGNRPYSNHPPPHGALPHPFDFKAASAFLCCGDRHGPLPPLVRSRWQAFLVTVPTMATVCAACASRQV